MSRYHCFYFSDSGHPQYRPWTLECHESDEPVYPNIPHCEPVEPVGIFDTTTVPPTLMPTQRTHEIPVATGKHPLFPEFYISPAGHIRRSCDNRLVMRADTLP